MKFANTASIRNIGIGLLALLTTVPLIYAQRSQQPQRGVPAHAPEEHRPVVDRVNHGTIRHVDTHTVQRPVETHRDVDAHRQVFIHHDVEVDVNHSRFWNGFVFGQRVGALRAGCLRVLLNGTPYYYDDGIYYQQAGDSYQEIYPPAGVGVPGLPDGATEILAGNLVYYYAGGAFYVQQGGGFVIVAPPMGVIVPELPPGAVQVSINGNVAYQFGIYYQPVFVNGVTQYMTFTP
jgi:hypothetical protein